jgi:hypothetical protein
MAMTVADKGVVVQTPFHVHKLSLSTIQAGARVTCTHTGPTDVRPVDVRLGEITTRPTSGCPVFLQWVGTSASANTVDIVLDTEIGGDLTGAVVEVLIMFAAHATGGLTDVS